jgi:hypothetical protein
MMLAIAGILRLIAIGEPAMCALRNRVDQLGREPRAIGTGRANAELGS